MKKSVVAGLGEIGHPVLKLLSKKNIVVGFDVKSDLINKKKMEKYKNLDTSFLHIAIPGNEGFISTTISLFKKFKPECIVIHSTISPGTTEKLQKKMPIPIIYSATRGVHKRINHDLKRYTKFFAISKNAPRKQWACSQFIKFMKNCGIKTRKMSKPVTLELAKIVCDTSYLGWLVNYAQISKILALKYEVDYDEMWVFADEIHKFLGNRPKMYPGIIGGHCVIPNLQLLRSQTLTQIKEMNDYYIENFKKSKH